ncbi:uncharacterized protein [Physcomitrium patens]|uniref:Uncharacterized protein n=1 Tax=Physcomitrium patens TaxID=3218 RepID=A0A7I4AJS5_PHYPA|nr:uncharacterized protein LOC112290263 isoform X2 [Physcomitrium patens]|eukprot:XP_024392146.1 uncharacterized protein LOC112290263 isoform X2 [Physcomitrella patens]
MTKRNLSLGGGSSLLSHTAPSPFPLHGFPGYDTAPKPVERPANPHYADCGLQQESQSKHPFLSRSCNPYSSQSQRSLSQGCLTQSQNTLRLSQNSQPEDYGCDQWKTGKEIALGQSQKPPPYFSGLTTSLNRRNSPGNVGGSQSAPASSTSTSAALCVVGPQNNTPRPWPQCNVSDELERRLGNLEKLWEAETAVLQKICDDYQQFKTLIEEACFESKDNRSKLSIQQDALQKLVKEEEAANSGIYTAVKASEDAILQDIKTLKQAVNEVAEEKNKTALKLMIQSLRDEFVSFKRDLKAEIPHPVQNSDMRHQVIIFAALVQLPKQRSIDSLTIVTARTMTSANRFGGR